MKKKFNIIMVAIIFFVTAVIPVNATENYVLNNLSDFELLNKITESGATQEESNNKIIKRLSESESNQYIDFPENSKKYIDQYNVYTIIEKNELNYNEHCVTVVTDVYLTEEGMMKVGVSPKASGGTSYNEKACGRVTGYVKIWYTNKKIKGRDTKKITQIGCKLTYVQGGVTVRKMQAIYEGSGGYYNSSGQDKGSLTNYVKTYNLSISNPKSLKTVNTSGIDRYYDANGAGALRGGLKVTYGGSNASSQVTYSVYANACTR